MLLAKGLALGETRAEARTEGGEECLFRRTFFGHARGHGAILGCFGREC
jgi:hypothetical protein